MLLLFMLLLLLLFMLLVERGTQGCSVAVVQPATEVSFFRNDNTRTVGIAKQSKAKLSKAYAPQSVIPPYSRHSADGVTACHAGGRICRPLRRPHPQFVDTPSLSVSTGLWPVRVQIELPTSSPARRLFVAAT